MPRIFDNIDRRLLPADQVRTGKLVVKLFLRHLLHAKLYLLFRQDIATPIIGSRYRIRLHRRRAGLHHQL